MQRKPSQPSQLTGYLLERQAWCFMVASIREGVSQQSERKPALGFVFELEGFQTLSNQGFLFSSSSPHGGPSKYHLGVISAQAVTTLRFVCKYASCDICDLHHTFIPQLLASPMPLPAMKPAYCPTPPIVPPTFRTSSSLRSRNSDVAVKSGDLSVVMNNSELA